ncbi:MAG: hypothetical protein ISR47_06610 [Rhodospirillales bacterium]|nr:hypothetical protein [Rhodospirillales bacterium]
MGLFDKIGKRQKALGPAQDPKWSRSASGHFRRFINLDPEEEGLGGKSGVFVIWHGGLRPRWVYAGASGDMAASLHDLAEDDEVMEFEINGGLFVTWAAIRQEFQPGVVKFLNESMEPLVENSRAFVTDDNPVAVVYPGKGK